MSDRQQGSVLNLVVAHRLEARPLIESLGLASAGRVGAAGFETYSNEAGIRLIVSGMGKAAAATATRALAELPNADHPTDRHVWLNIGIAGHRSLPVGSSMLANKLVDAQTGQVHFPTLLLPGPASGCLVTVNEAETEYPLEAAYDMEAAGFFAAARSAGPLELVQVYKLISDNPQHPTERVDRALIARLFADKRTEIIDFCTALRCLGDDYNLPRRPSPAIDKLLQSLRMSVSQQHQLRRLGQRLQALGQSSYLLALADRPPASAQLLLRSMERFLIEAGNRGPTGNSEY